MKKLFSIFTAFAIVAFLAVSCDTEPDVEVEDTDVVVEDTTTSILGSGDAETQYNVTLNGTVKTLEQALRPDTIAQTGGTNAPEVGQDNKMIIFESQGTMYLVFNSDGTYAGNRLQDKIGQTMTLTGDVKKTKGLNMLVTNLGATNQPM